MASVAKMKTVYVITERGGKSYWTKIGVGFTNRDGSLSLKLDALPVTGSLQVRDYEPRDRDWERKAPPEEDLASRSSRATPRDDFPGSFS